MAYREVTMIGVKEILRLWLARVPKLRIARSLRVDRKTVHRYTELALEHGLAPGQGAEALTEERLEPILVALKSSAGRPHGEGWERCCEHRAFIEQKLEAGLKLSKIRRLMLRQGVDVAYPTLHRFAVSELGHGRRACTIPVADGEPGSELQLDTGWVGWLERDVSGTRRRFRAWIFTAVVSRHRFVWPAFRETTREAIDACEEAWQFFGGIFPVLIPDNTKAIVDQADPLGARLNAAFLEYAQARGFHIDPARSRQPTDKARVERAVQPARDDCFAGEVLRTIEDAREHARRWSLRDYGMRRHSTTRRMPLEHFEAEEKPRLLPAPAERYDIPLWCDPKVGRDQLAQVDRALGHAACCRRFSVVATRADQMLKTLKHARLDNSYEAELRKLIATDLLIIDDFALDARWAREPRRVRDLHRAAPLRIHHHHLQPRPRRMACHLRRPRAGTERHRPLHEQLLRPRHRGRVVPESAQAEAPP